MSLGQVLVRWHTTEFSLLMKHLNAHLEFSTHFANRLNPEPSQLLEA
jgi:hypothetical protein